MIRSLLVLTAAAALIGGAAQAQTDDEGRSVAHVSYADLDINHEAGARAFLRRVDTAIDEVCHKPEMLALNEDAEFQACRRQAVTKVLVSTRSPMVAALTGQSLALSEVASR